MARFVIRSPIDDRPVGSAPVLGARAIDRAVRGARAAQPAWAGRSRAERRQIIRRAAANLRRDAAAIARLLMAEVGKTPAEARDEVMRSADLMAVAADEAARLRPEVHRSEAFPGTPPGRVQTVDRVPWGVILAIAPFNYPVNLAVSKLAPALVMGNAAVFKPPTQGTLAGRRAATAFHAAGVPRAVLPVVTGPASRIGDRLIDHPDVDMVAMTGSVPVGKRIAARTGMIPLLLELGGNDAAIVLADADLDRAAEAIVAGAFKFAGQRCTAVKRVYVVRSVADRLAGRIVERVVSRFGSVGDPREHPLGPVISDRQAVYLAGLVRDACRRGARVLAGGRREGRYVQATVLNRVPAAARVVVEEQFGPVLPIVRVGSAAEAARLADDSPFGLQASVFTRRRSEAARVARALAVGGVHWNGPDQRGPDTFMFTGAKDSGLGVQGIRYSLEAMSRPKGFVENR